MNSRSDLRAHLHRLYLLDARVIWNGVEHRFGRTALLRMDGEIWSQPYRELPAEVVERLVAEGRKYVAERRKI